MGIEINQSTFDELQSYVNEGNYTQFYTTLYQNGSTISGCPSSDKLEHVSL